MKLGGEKARRPGCWEARRLGLNERCARGADLRSLMSVSLEGKPKIVIVAECVRSLETWKLRYWEVEKFGNTERCYAYWLSSIPASWLSGPF